MRCDAHKIPSFTYQRHFTSAPPSPSVIRRHSPASGATHWPAQQKGVWWPCASNLVTAVKETTERPNKKRTNPHQAQERVLLLLLLLLACFFNYHLLFTPKTNWATTCMERKYGKPGIYGKYITWDGMEWKQETFLSLLSLYSERKALGALFHHYHQSFFPLIAHGGRTMVVQLGSLSHTFWHTGL